jgi:hypothetical protein
MKRQIWVLLLVFGFSFLFSGCYYFAARDQMKTATKLVSDLKGQGGEKLVPYEYCSAQTYLEVSRMEFYQYDYKQAKKFADRSTSAAEAGLVEVKKKK